MKKKRIVLILFLISLVCLFSSCGGKQAVGMEIVMAGDGEMPVYYTGETLDKDGGSLLPAVYLLYEDGSRSDDVSRTDQVAFFGYDLSFEGEQEVQVSCGEVTESYPITVICKEILFIEAEDPFHSTVGSFRVGDKFTTYSVREDGVERGVTITVHYRSEIVPRAAYFTNAEEMKDAQFDTSLCKLDDSGCFTEPGEFTVGVTFSGVTASYQITVTE